MRVQHFHRALGTGLMFIGLVGCAGDAQVDDGLARQAVAGTVTMDGQPLDSGQIQFIPTDPSSGGGTSGTIQGGRFEIDDFRGPAPGTYQVVISSQAPAMLAEGEMPGEAPPPSPEEIPAIYNRNTTLNATVDASGENTFEYVLKSK